MTFRIALTGDFQKDGKIIYPDFDLTKLKTTNGIEYDFDTWNEIMKGKEGLPWYKNPSMKGTTRH